MMLNVSSFYFLLHPLHANRVAFYILLENLNFSPVKREDPATERDTSSGGGC